MSSSFVRGIVVLAIASALVAGCGDDDDDGNGSAQSCEQFSNPCAACTCRACPCDSACQRGSRDLANCLAACFRQDGGDPIACLGTCTANLSGSTRVNFDCAQAAGMNQCASSC